MERKELGRIRKVAYGLGGYQDAQFGLGVMLGGEGWGVNDFNGFWSMSPSSGAQWTEADQDRHFAETSRYVLGLLKAAKVSNVADLEGTPIEATFDGNKLTSWRILKEVL